MSKKATIEELNELHGILARTLAERIRSGEFTASELNVARQFLKDNGIEQVAIPGTPVADLAAVLPFAGADAEAFHITQ